MFLLLLSLFQGKVTYHQTMTPAWLKAHASYLDSSATLTEGELKFNVNQPKYSAILKVPLIPAGVFQDACPLTVEIAVALNVDIGKTADSDFNYGVSDGTKFVGFATVDQRNFGNTSPCYNIEGESGTTLTLRETGPYTPKPSDSFYPGQFVFTFKLDERFGSCYIAHDGGFVRTAGYYNQLMPSNGLNLEVYTEDGQDDQVGIRFIKVAIIQDEA